MSVKQLISFSTKVKARQILQGLKGIDPNFQYLTNLKGPKAFVFLAADYGNLGDVAITYAQEAFLKKYLPDFHIIDLPISKTIEAIHAVKKCIGQGDLITTVGGGNFGNRYDQIEFYRQLIIETFPDHKIVAFPQTIEFSEDTSGNEARKAAKKIYQAHSNLVLGAREQRSFEEMQQDFPKNKVTLSPDIVMSLDKREPKKQRQGAILSMRMDSEKKLNAQEEALILNEIEKQYPNPSRWDTHIGTSQMTMEERIHALNQIWAAFRGAELVVTDRLHGMIFCYITGTPCLVFQNSNHKIVSSHHWISFSPRIKIIREVNKASVRAAMDELKNSLLSEDGYRDLSPYYQEFIGQIK